MIRVNKAELLLAVFGAKKEMDNTVHISRVILIQLKLKINFEMCRIRPFKVLRDQLCKKNLR